MYMHQIPLKNCIPKGDPVTLNKMLKNLSTTGIVLVTIYLATTIGLVAYAQTLSDPKSKFLFLQLPIVLQHALLMELDLNNLLRGVSWPFTYLALVPPMCVILYLIGRLFEFISSKLIHGRK